MGHRERETWEKGLFWVTIVIFAIISIGGLIISLIVGPNGIGLSLEDMYSMQLSTWLLAWSILALIGAIFYTWDYCLQGKLTRTPFHATAPGWIWGLVSFFLATIWAFIGQVLLLSKFTSISGEASTVYGFSIAALIVSYIMLFYYAWIVSYHMYHLGAELAINRTALVHAKITNEMTLKPTGALRWYMYTSQREK